VRRSVIRVVLAVAVVAAGGVAWADLVAAAGKEINATADAAKCDKTWGPPCFTPSNGTVTQVAQGDTVTWKVLDGTHTVTPVDPSAFGESGDLTGPDGTFSVTFDKVGVFSFYCKHHGSVEDGGKTHHGMWGKIDVKAGDTTTTTAPPPGNDPPPSNPDPTPAPAPPPTHPPAPPPSGSPPPATSNGSTGGSGANGQGGSGQTAAGSGRPWVGPPPTQAAPPPTRAAFSGPPPTEPKSPAREKERERESSSDSTSPPEATAVPPDEAVLPPSPQFPTPTTAPLAENPGDVHGDTIAVLKNEAGGRKRKLVLFGTLFGVGAFAAGVGGWKYMNRPSKYWPA
jgi:plastocyanin